MLQASYLFAMRCMPLIMFVGRSLNSTSALAEPINALSVQHEGMLQRQWELPCLQMSSNHVPNLPLYL